MSWPAQKVSVVSSKSNSSRACYVANQSTSPKPGVSKLFSLSVKTGNIKRHVGQHLSGRRSLTGGGAGD